MSEIHQWKMITHEHCNLVSPRVLHKKRRSTLKWCCDDHNVFWGGWDQVCCLLISNSGAGCCSSNFFFWCWAYQILSVRIWNWLVKDTMFLATLLMLAECMIATIPFLHKPEHNSCWGWSVWPGLQSNYIYLVLLASVICLQSWKLRRISDAAEAFVLKICWYKTSSWGLGFNLSSCSPCLVQTSQKLKWLWKLQVTMAKAKMKMKTKMQHLSMFHQMRNCNHRSAYTVLILESTDPVKIDLLRSLPEAKHEALRIHLRSCDW